MRSGLVLVLLVAACGAPTSKYSGQTEIVDGEDQLRERASHDLGCPAAQVTAIPLGGNRVNAAAEGCGKREVYVRVPGDWINATPK